MEITVRRGDQLERIAAAYGVSEEELLKLNGMTSNQLTVGQMLKVPLSGAGAALLATSPAADEASKGGKSSLAKKKAPAVEKKAKGSQEPVYYIVKKGDSPWTIAQKHKIKLEELLSLNNLDEKKARRLKEGDKLRVK
jgi:LysM repeat protein